MQESGPGPGQKTQCETGTVKPSWEGGGQGNSLGLETSYHGAVNLALICFQLLIEFVFQIQMRIGVLENSLLQVVL
jgi:hypothetical protein